MPPRSVHGVGVGVAAPQVCAACWPAPAAAVRPACAAAEGLQCGHQRALKAPAVQRVQREVQVRIRVNILPNGHNSFNVDFRYKL